jgi:hypothetical protein
MGMDVYGKDAKNEKGEYFRRNVWGWRPLWNYCVDNYEDLVGEVSGHYNDGDGLDEAGSLELAKRIKNDLASGKASEYIDQRNAYLASLERPTCDLCSGTGIRDDEVGVENGMPDRELPDEMKMLTGRSHGWCNACSGEGRTDHWDTHYFLDLDDLKEFAEFLENSGGFSIC